MLSTAIRRARWAMVIASPTRSPIGEDDDVGGLRGGARSARPERDPHVGAGQSRSVVDAVADHDSGIEPLFGAHGVDLVRRDAVGKHGVEIERGAHRLRGGCPVARDHDDAPDPRLAQHADRVRRLGSELIGEQQRPDRAVLDCNENDERRPPGAAPYGAQRPLRRLPVRKDQIAGAGAHALSRNHAAQARAHALADPFRHAQRQRAFGRRLHDGAGNDMVRSLFERGAQHEHVVGFLSRRDLD